MVERRLVDDVAFEAPISTRDPGERLTQEAIAERLSVSRQPVSHALQLLKRQGLVIEHGRRGLSVAPIEANRMRDLYQLRAAIEGLASRLAAERVVRGEAGAEIDRLSECLTRGSSLASDAPLHDWIESDVAFHQSVYRLSGNVAVAETVTGFLPHFKRCMGTSLSNLEVRAAIWGEHAAIAEGILSGAPRAAESAATHHAEKAGNALYHRLTQKVGIESARRA